MATAAQSLIRKLGLKEHPEGGWYREIFRSSDNVSTPKGRRSALTTIYFLLARGQTSVFHRVTSDEVWHYYEGAPLRLWRVSEVLKRSERIALGPTGRGRTQVAVIAAGEWQAAETTGDYTLVGCTVAPGFDFNDFMLLRDAPREAERMRKAFPALAKRFT